MLINNNVLFKRNGVLKEIIYRFKRQDIKVFLILNSCEAEIYITIFGVLAHYATPARRACTHSQKECTFRGHHQGQHNVTTIVQLKEVHAPATDLSKYFTSDQDFILQYASESENLCGYSKRKGCSKLTEKTILLIKKVYDSKLLEKLMISCG